MKKGFTLIEMLAVIVVLALIMTIAIRSIGAVRESQLKKVAEEKVHNIEKAAILYAQENPSIFDTATESIKCSNSSYNESTMPGISDYKDYEDCIIVAAIDLATNNYLDCDYENDTYILRNDYTGENMLSYYVAIYRNNNRVNAFVAVKENKDIADGYIASQQSVPQGGIYSSCASGRYKILTKEGTKDVYKCGLGTPAEPSIIINDENNNPKKGCQIADFALVFGNEEYCCSKNNMVFIEGYCVSVKADLLTKPNCPNTTDYQLSDNYNMCTYTRTVTESTCSTGIKTLANGKYYCVNTPKCSSGYVLSYDYKYCTKNNSTLESTCSVGTKTYANDKYYCLSEPTCPTNREMSFDLNYCE